MSYSAKNLAPGEKIVYSAALSLWPFSGHLLGGAAIAASLLFLPLTGLAKLFIVIPAFCLWLFVYVKIDTTELVITNKRVIIKTGLVQRKTQELYLTRVEGVEVDQSFNGRLLNYGTIFVRGVGTEVAPINNVCAPMAFRMAFFKTSDEAIEDGPDSGGLGPISKKQGKS